jgi:hypothetical protein
LTLTMCSPEPFTCNQDRLARENSSAGQASAALRAARSVAPNTTRLRVAT